MKRFLVFLFVGLGLLFLVFSLVFFFQKKEPEPESEPVVESDDIILPVTAIRSPEDRSWHNTGFVATILDADLGLGLAEGQACDYLIENVGAGQVFGDKRPCGKAQVFISVGEGKACSSSFDAASNTGICKLTSKARDKAGNESSFQTHLFYIDFTKPIIQKASIADVVQPKEELLIEASVSDNGKITGCRFFVDGKRVEVETKISFVPCEHGRTCTVSLSHAFSEPGEHTAFFACVDSAENTGVGEPVSFEVFENKPPEIALCRVFPTRGTSDTVFEFQVEATDSNEDTLSFLWDFGDGTTSQVQSPDYSYTQRGTFRPKVAVQDPSGERVLCNTAWVIIQE